MSVSSNLLKKTINRMKGYIYGLYKNNDENDIFYIGATTNPAGRLISHKQKYPYHIFYCTIQMSILEEVEFNDIKELRTLENYWIQQFVAWGFKLSNYNLGYGKDTRLMQLYNNNYNDVPVIMWPYV